MITEETYLEMVRLVKLYECDGFEDSSNKPYIETITIETTRKYNPNYDDDIDKMYMLYFIFRYQII